MTTLRQAAQQALEALEGELWLMLDKPEDEQYRVKYAYLLTVITALRTALEQQAETPPEWPLVKNILDEYGLDAISFVAEWKAAQRPWVDLTDGDWEWVADKKETSLDTFAHGAAWAADQLKEKNT
jgi:hypothetical protein